MMRFRVRRELLQGMLYKDFKQLVLDERPLIDVRAPIEFEKGAFETSVNIPIMDDEERKMVGIVYKHKGEEEATKLGLGLVSGENKEEKLNKWNSVLENHPKAVFYCFRGGSRSAYAQKWMKESFDVDVPRIEGGYKYFRSFAIRTLLPENIKVKPVVLGGYTGSGKTILLKKFDNFVDLEGIANHRGSSFGAHATPQPTQINFENNLAFDLIRKEAKGFEYIIMEDEGRHIGKNFLPPPFQEYFRSAEVVIVDVPLEKRIQITLEEYVTAAQKEYTDMYGLEEGYEKWREVNQNNIMRLERRLGKQKLQEALVYFEKAYEYQMKTGKIDAHEIWISLFLKEYFDKAYQYQIKKDTREVAFRGNEKEVVEFLKERYSGHILG